MTKLRLLVLPVVATLGAAVARAETPAMAITDATVSAIELHSPVCAAGPYDGARLLALLKVELGAIGISDVRDRGTGPVSAPLPSDLVAAVVLSAPRCEAADEVTIQVVDRATSKIVQRTMAIADVAFDERPRALAIAVAELLQASWAELELGASAPPGVNVPPEIRAAVVQRLAPAPVSPAPAPDARAPFPRPPRLAYVAPTASRVLLDAAALVRAFPGRDTALLGGAVSVSVPLGTPWAVHAGADAGYGDSRVANGTVGVTAVTGSAGIAAVAGNATTLEVGPRVHAGYVWASGSPSSRATSGSSYSHFVALAALSATLRVPASGFTALCGLDVGAVFEEASFLADNARVAGFGGVMLAARLGLGI